MIIPEKLTVTAIDQVTGCPIPEVALLLELKAHRKNNYSVGPVITNGDGQAEFTREACEKAIASAQEMFVMDYVGDLQSCSSVAELQLHSPESIANMIRNYESHPDFWGSPFDAPEELFAALRNARNSLFQHSCLAISEKDIAEHPSVSFRLSRK